MSPSGEGRGVPPPLVVRDEVFPRPSLVASDEGAPSPGGEGRGVPPGGEGRGVPASLVVRDEVCPLPWW